MAALLCLAPAAAAGDGSLEAPRQIEALSPVSVTAADLDGDVRIDLATAALDGKLGAILARAPRRDGWELLPLVRHGERAFYLRAADFDGDGDDDLAVADLSGTSFVLRSQGDGTFDAPILLSQARQT